MTTSAPLLPVVCPCGARFSEEFARQKGMKCILCGVTLTPDVAGNPLNLNSDGRSAAEGSPAQGNQIGCNRSPSGCNADALARCSKCGAVVEGMSVCSKCAEPTGRW